MFDLRTKQDLNRGFSDALGRGVDLALTPVVFGLVGWLIDRAAGTSPWFTIIVATLGVVGTAVKIKLGYDKEMGEHTSGPASTPRQVAPAPLRSQGPKAARP